MGGIGAGMICLNGTGGIVPCLGTQHPEHFDEPAVFAALSAQGPRRFARVLEGPVPGWKLLPQFPTDGDDETKHACWGLPRYRQAAFTVRFPFGNVVLTDEQVPISVDITGWSPFEPGSEDDSSLPVAALEYQLRNYSNQSVAAVFSFNAMNFMAAPQSPPTGVSRGQVRSISGGFLLYGAGAPDKPWEEGTFAAWVDDPAVKVNYAWFRGREGWLAVPLKARVAGRGPRRLL